MFYPVKLENVQTTEFCAELSVGSASTILTELTDPTKSTHHYVSKANGKYSQLKITDKDVTATLGNRAKMILVKETLPPSHIFYATVAEFHSRVLLELVKVDTTKIWHVTMRSS